MRAYVRFVLFPGCMAMLVCLAGCSNGFNDQVGAASGQALDLQSEQVSLTPAEASCAIDNDLFLAPAQTGNRKIASLTDKGRSLGFSDDLTLEEPGLTSPYTQIRGKFPVQFSGD